MRKRILSLMLIGIVISSILVSCKENVSKNVPTVEQTTTATNQKFSEADAISKLIKEHPDFPVKPSEVIIKKLPTGGPSGTTANVMFSTSIENIEKGTYAITLTKDWGITVNGKYAKSYWKYKVTSSSITLTDSIDNDYLPNSMK